jgi:predicted MFS family arabinose efflux permease
VTARDGAAERAAPSRRAVALLVLVAALGYFVDIYDLILFGVVRKPSLAALGVADADMLAEGERLLRYQMAGLLLGGILWGIVGDRRGRLSVLFGSIITYSLANLANAYVTDLDQYAALRFVAGVGLAGELGAGITLVSEVMGRQHRGWGTTVVATVGICGGVVAALVGGKVEWRTAYLIGGGLGLALLVLRLGVRESGMFVAARQTAARRGAFLDLFRDLGRLRRYLAIILVGVPIWYAVGILVFFSAEIGRALGVAPAPVPARALLWTYAGLAVGDLASGVLSQQLGSRRRALAIFLALTTLTIAAYFTLGARSRGWFYGTCAGLGVATGYWAVFVTSAAEQFGTNLRATVTTTVPNFVRGMVVPMTFAYESLRGSLGIVTGALALGGIVLALAVAALASLDETFGKDLDYLERGPGDDLPPVTARSG